MEINHTEVTKITSTTSIPPYKEIKHIFDDEGSALNYLIEEGILQVPFCCETLCRQEGGQDKMYMYRCKNKLCRKKYSIRNNTIFRNSKLKTNDIMLIVYLWISKAGFETIKLITNHENKTITDWMNTCKTILIHGMDDYDDGRKVDEVTGEIIFTGQLPWYRFLQAMKTAHMIPHTRVNININQHNQHHMNMKVPHVVAGDDESGIMSPVPLLLNDANGMAYLNSMNI